MKLLAIDANSILNRSYYGVRGLTNSKGLPTNAVFGFYNVIAKMIKETSPDCIVAAFDLSAPTFRHKQYDQYKANRHGMPDDLAVQLPYSKKMLTLLGIHIVEQEGFEADDTLGTLARLSKEQNYECVIATGDRDSLQLVGGNVTVRLATNKEAIIYDEQGVIDQYGVTPKELLEVKALMGDSSDNIPGVKGIGEKTAISLISKHHDIDTVFDNVQDLDATNRVKNLLSADGAEDLARLSKTLGTIATDVPIKEDLSSYKRGEIQCDQFVDFLKELEFKKILQQFQQTHGLNSEPKQKSQPVEEKQTVLNSDTSDVIKALEGMDQIDFYLGESLFIFAEGTVFEFSEKIDKAFSEIITSSDKPKRTTGLKELYHYCMDKNLELKNVTMSCDIASYLVDILEQDYSLNALAERYISGGVLPQCFPNLCSALEKRIKEKQLTNLLKAIELPLSNVLAEMEVNGFAVDRESLKSFGDMLSLQIVSLQSQVCDLAGEEFNINSTKELGRILFEKLELPTGRKTKTGYSTNAEVLEKLVKHHPIAEKVLEYRTLTKLMSTYVTGLMKVIGDDGRVHSLFKQTGTRTGRISSTEPNMQNIPIRTELGSEMRKFFVAKPGSVLLDADYSQIELRVLAHISGDGKMIDAFKNGQDIHNLTASEVFGFDPSLVPADLRRRAKTINFAVIYGIGAFSLSKDIGVSVAEAQKYIDSYFNGYSGVRHYMDDIVKEAEETGKVKTMFGRIRRIPELKAKNHNIRSFGERVARNTPIQGTAADIIKIAMVKVQQCLKEEKLDARLILQVHDELLIESSEADSKKAAKILKDEMENAAELSVPLVADVFIGKNWYDAKS